jgi:hypothetical protein
MRSVPPGEPYRLQLALKPSIARGLGKSAQPAHDLRDWIALLGKPCSASSLSRHQKRAGKSSRAAQFERPKILVPVSFGNIWILCLPFRQFKEIILGNLPLAGAFTKMGPLLSWKPLPLDLRHWSLAEDQSTEFIYYLILASRIVVRQIRLELLEEFTLSLFLALQAEAHESGDGLAHAGINGSRISLHLPRQR